MPYLKFKTAQNAEVELKGESLADFRAAIEKHGRVARTDLALAWVEAYFTRRTHQIAKQKAEQAGDEDAADAAYDRMVEAEAAEERTKQAYYAQAMQAAPAAAAAAATTSAASPDNPYADVMGDTKSAAPVDEDDFL